MKKDFFLLYKQKHSELSVVGLLKNKFKCKKKVDKLFFLTLKVQLGKNFFDKIRKIFFTEIFILASFMFS